MGRDYQVQEEVDEADSFLNIQYRGVGNRAIYLATTEQLLDGFSHIGNRNIVGFEPDEEVSNLASSIASIGVRDVFGIDVATTPEGLTVIECNARWNGSTYPSIVAQRLGAKDWTSCAIKTTLDRAKEIKLDGIAYDKSKGTGVVMLNVGHLATHGKVNAIFIGPEEAQEEYRVKLGRALSKLSDEGYSSQAVAA